MFYCFRSKVASNDINFKDKNFRKHPHFTIALQNSLMLSDRLPSTPSALPLIRSTLSTLETKVKVTSINSNNSAGSSEIFEHGSMSTCKSRDTNEDLEKSKLKSKLINYIKQQIKLDHLKKQRKLIKMLLFSFVVMAISWLPFTLIIIIDINSKLQSVIYVLFMCVGWTSSTFNAMLYAVMNTQFRHAYWNLLQGRRWTATTTLSSKQQMSSEISRALFEHYQGKEIFQNS